MFFNKITIKYLIFMFIYYIFLAVTAIFDVSKNYYILITQSIKNIQIQMVHTFNIETSYNLAHMLNDSFIAYSC